MPLPRLGWCPRLGIGEGREQPQDVVTRGQKGRKNREDNREELSRGNAGEKKVQEENAKRVEAMKRSSEVRTEGALDSATRKAGLGSSLGRNRPSP